MRWPSLSARQMPVKVATAPISVRPRVSAAISAPMSKSSRCSRINSASGHRRKECDLARARDRHVGLHMRMVDRGADDLGVLECVGILLAASGQPRHEVANCAHIGRRIDLLLRLADALAYPGEVQQFHVSSVVPAKAGTHNPEPNNCALPVRLCKTCGYGSRLARPAAAWPG